jgi:hypothetical protein
MPSPSDTEAHLLDSFGLTDAQRLVVDEAHREAPKGLIVVALECRRYGQLRATSATGLLMHRIKLGEHYDEELKLDPIPKGPRRTGWRMVRGSHAATFIPDPLGTDEPPRWHD